MTVVAYKLINFENIRSGFFKTYTYSIGKLAFPYKKYRKGWVLDRFIFHIPMLLKNYIFYPLLTHSPFPMMTVNYYLCSNLNDRSWLLDLLAALRANARGRR